ncbi:MAG: hypothetical protein CO094_00840 [Anaerolineae bacterium CG_4_9_14_3_um_filter_57_17]|nr:PQQ-binding-like beta-propeller repeat protein [bacterium]NCT21223.1 PQQ-binding-like beta-propeller repeat protein [bacterium]OIO84251.1 MAG: hypothetical protein AUK01_10135 [Anaerolineae bacterium CG2_30_57_67]PJB68599.1 MAG: hypothetical protein CO094_00840 [Anaerolineae bacterium CG_4_9_14_3_um_filter_57_17]
MNFKRPLLLALFILLAVLLTACGSAPATNWPGLATDGVTLYLAEGQRINAIQLSDGKDVMIASGDKQVPFRFPLDTQTTAFYAPPAILPNGQMVIGNASQSEFSLFWYDLATGAQVHAFDGAKKPWFAGAVVVGEDFFVPAGDGNLYGFTMDGQKRWQFAASSHALWTTPTSDGITLFLGTLDHQLYAINAETGQQTWKISLDNGVIGSPTLVNGTLYVGTLSGELYAINAADGVILWQKALTGGIWSAPALNVDATSLYIGTVNGTAGMFYIVNAATGEIIRSIEETKGSITATPLVLPDQVVYVTDTGSIYWVTPAGDPIRQPVVLENAKLYTAPMLVGDLIIIAPMNYANLLLAFDMNGAQKWAYTPEK